MVIINILGDKVMRKLFYLLTIAVLAFITSCELNTAPEFNDGDAFVAFDKVSLSINENGDTLLIPVTLASISGKSAVVGYSVIDSTAKQGVNFELVDGSATLTFDAANRTQYIAVVVNDNPGVFTGDLRFLVQLSEDGTVKPNAENACLVTINDLDHPLAAILGTWTASGTSYFNGEEAWDMELTKDPDDISVVWFLPFVKGGANKPIYGVVNEAKTEIKIPVGQEINTPGSYGFIELRSFYGPDGANEIPDGGNITIEIREDGKLYIMDEIGSYVWGNADKSDGLGWFNIFQADIILSR